VGDCVKDSFSDMQAVTLKNNLPANFLIPGSRLLQHQTRHDTAYCPRVDDVSCKRAKIAHYIISPQGAESHKTVFSVAEPGF
jgi:hypothetical protein